MNKTSVTVRLTPNTTYEWWVSARNEYAIGADSPKWRFRTPATSLAAPQEGIVEGEWGAQGAVWSDAPKE